MTWTEIISKRTQTGKHWYDPANPAKRKFQQVLRTPLHYASQLDGSFDTEVDFAPVRINNAALDGWVVTRSGWHYALGIPGSGDLAGLDGVVGFGGRQGSHWIKFRLQRVGYLHWATRNWQDLGDQPTYDRSKLSRSVQSLTVGPNSQTVRVANITEWSGVWPGVSVRWRVDGLQLKEEIYLSQTVRDNLPNPGTPAAQTYFCFAFRLDVSDVPHWVKNGLQQDINGDFNDVDGHHIELQDAANRLLAFMPIDYAIADDGETRVRLRKRIYKQGADYWLLIGAPVLDLAALPAGGITFDPTFSDQPGEALAVDTYIDQANPTTTNSTNTELRSDPTHSTGKRRWLIRWDLSSIPAGATCDSAVLSLYAGNTNSGRTAGIFIPIPAWTEGGATWNTYDGSNNWPGSAGASTPGTDYEADADPPVITQASGVDTESQVDLTTGDNLTAARIEAQFGGELNLVGGQTGNSQCVYRSSNYGTAGARPKLTIDYTEAPPPPPTGNGPGIIIKSRGDTEANWLSVNPVLSEREIGLEIDTNRFKVGDGVSAWSVLPYWLDTSLPHTHPHDHDADYSPAGHDHPPSGHRTLLLSDINDQSIPQYSSSYTIISVQFDVLSNAWMFINCSIFASVSTQTGNAPLLYTWMSASKNGSGELIHIPLARSREFPAGSSVLLSGHNNLFVELAPGEWMISIEISRQTSDVGNLFIRPITNAPFESAYIELIRFTGSVEFPIGI